MLSRPARLNDSKDILQVYRQGQRRSIGPVSCILLNAPTSRATVVIDTKVSKKATERNVAKRRIRAALRQYGLPKGDLIVRLYPGATTISYEELIKNLLGCLNRL